MFTRLIKLCVPFAIVAGCTQAAGSGGSAPTEDAGSVQVDVQAPAPDVSVAQIVLCETNPDCAPLNKTTCDVQFTCVSGQCVRPKGATYPKEGTACDDKLACTTGDACDGVGYCKGVSVVCDNSNPCVVSSCDAKLGKCVASPIATAIVCDDGDACTTGDSCKAGSCEGATLPCNDGNACTDDSCDKAKGCVYANNTAACDDGNVCTTADTCAVGACKGSTLKCDDGNPCTTDSCDAKLGCQTAELKDGSKCDDGNPATENDVCTAGTCEGLPAYDCNTDADCLAQPQFKGNLCIQVTCDTDLRKCLSEAKLEDDGNECTEDAKCDPQTGVFKHLPIVGKSCTDGNLCTDGDICDKTAACKGTVVTCDDGDKCTDDSCLPLLGCQFVPWSFATVTAKCNDQKYWTLDTCDSQVGCEWTPLFFTMSTGESSDIMGLYAPAPYAMILTTIGNSWGYFKLAGAPNYISGISPEVKISAQLFCDAYDVGAAKGTPPIEFGGTAYSMLNKGKDHYAIGGPYMTVQDPLGALVPLVDLGPGDFDIESNIALPDMFGPGGVVDWCAKFKK